MRVYSNFLQEANSASNGNNLDWDTGPHLIKLKPSDIKPQQCHLIYCEKKLKLHKA